MARAYICVARNDLDENLLQILDLSPNSSHFIPSLSAEGQTGYVTWTPQHDTVATTAPGGVITTSADYYGLAAYMWDNVEDNDNGNIHLTAARCNTIATAILSAVGAGTALTLAAIDAIIQAATGGGASGLATAHSIGTVEEVLRIVSGEVYLLPAGSVSGAAASFVDPRVRAGSFLAVGSSGYRNFRKIANAGSLHVSALTGALSKLKASTYTWKNPSYTYGASGTAFAINGSTHIGATGAHAAVTVYDAAGNVI